MKTVLLQRDIVWDNPEQNVERLEKAISEAPAADLYVIPEMFSTGFATVPDGIAEPLTNCKGLQWMKRASIERNCAVAGSILVQEEDGRYFNRFYFVTPDRIWQYDKHHLFTYSGEHMHITPGSEKVTAEWKGVKFRLSVCYDLRFPAWNRNTGNPYDVLIFVASWPQKRSSAWKSLLRARAIENQCYVIGVNRVGTDPSCTYSGDSALIDPFGETVVECTPCKECMVCGDIDMESLRSFRESFPVLNDADDIVIR